MSASERREKMTENGKDNKGPSGKQKNGGGGIYSLASVHRATDIYCSKDHDQID